MERVAIGKDCERGDLSYIKHESHYSMNLIIMVHRKITDFTSVY